MKHLLCIQSGTKKETVVLRVLNSLIMDQFKEIPLLESLLYSRKMHVIFATYLQNVTTLPCKMASNDKVIQ